MTTPEQLARLQARAIENPMEEPAFFQALLTAVLYVHLPLSDDSGKVRLICFTRPDGITIFTLDELAAYLKVGKRTLYRLAAHGEIPAFKVGGTWRFRQSEIDRWINDQIQAGRKKEVMRTDEQPKSAKHPVLPGRAIHSRRQTD